MTEPTQMDPNAVDAELTPGLRVPPDHEEEEVECNTKQGVKTATVYTFQVPAVVDVATWRPGNPEFDGAEYGEEVFRVRFKVTDGINKDRRVDDQFLSFYFGLITRSWDELRALKDAAEKGQFERRLGALKFNTLNNMRFMKKFLRALGYSERLSAARKNFIDFTTIMDLLDNKGAMLQDIPVLITIRKGELNYKGAATEQVVDIEAI